MVKLTSKKHPIKFYLTLIFVTVLYVSVSVICLASYNKASTSGKIKPKEKLLPLVSIGLFILAGYGFYRYHKNAPTIVLDKDFASFNNETFAFSELDKIQLTGKKPFKYVFDIPAEAAALSFKGGVTKYLFDDMYANSPEMKSFLKAVIIDKKEFVPNNYQVDVDAVNNEIYDTYKGNQFTSMRGIILWATIAFSSYSILNSNRGLLFNLIAAFAFSIFWFVLSSYQMHYFKLSENYLIVHNHNLLWRKRIFKIEGIKEIVFETSGKMPNCMRIITHDFKSKIYPAGTLSNKTWLLLKEHLEAVHIHVRNECI